MKFLAFLNRHKTKLTGLALAIIGSLQASSAALQELVTPRTFAWFTVGAGALVAVLGFLNSAIAKESEAVRRFKAALTDTHTPPEHAAANHTGNDEVQ